jgi:uncharacterized protein (TIGR02466 family)
MSENALVPAESASYTAATTEFNKLNYQPIFPTLITTVKLDLPVAEMKAGLLQLAGESQNYEGGFTTFFNRQELDHVSGIKQLKEAIYGIACAFGRELKYECNYDKCSIQLWVNVMRKGGYHPPHNHARSTFSGTYYAEVNDNMSPFVFFIPTKDLRMHDPVVRPEDAGPFTSEQMIIKPETGSLSMWPSWLYHHVPQMNVDGPRVSLSFNVDFLPPGA